MGSKVAILCVLVISALFLCRPPAADAIQILEHTTKDRTGKVVKHWLTIGVTQAQLQLGPIDGFFVNLFLFPFIGPSPEIITFTIILPNKGAGNFTIAKDGESAMWTFDEPIVSPTTLDVRVDVKFDPGTPVGIPATYHFSSMDSLGEPIETLEFESVAPRNMAAGPSLSQWGLILLGVLVLVAGTVAIRRSSQRRVKAG